MLQGRLYFAFVRRNAKLTNCWMNELDGVEVAPFHLLHRQRVRGP
jgi:hypothetical protein